MLRTKRPPYLWPLLFRLHGSPFPRTIPFALLSVGVQIVLHFTPGVKQTMQEAFGHPYGFQVYAFVIGFLVVLRTNHALARFMEARGHVEQMGSKWADAVVMCVSFDSCTTGKRSASGDEPMDMNAPLSEGSEHFIARLTHLVSLMHALALQHLRGDETLSNLTAAIRRKDGGPQLPEYNGTYFDFGPSAAASAHQQQHDGDRVRGRGSENGVGVGVGNGSSAAAATDVGVEITGGVEAGARVGARAGAAAGFENNGVLATDGGTGDDDESSFDLMDAERTCHYHLKGAHLMHATQADDTRDQRWKEWNMKHTFMLVETSEEWKACNRCMPLDVIGGVDPNEVNALRRLDVDRQYLVMSWIQSLIMLRSETPEGLRVPPPILSRVHQVLSDGFLGFNQADKIATTPFPMPYSQMLTVCLLVFNIILPVMVVATIDGTVLAMVLTCMSTVAYQGLNEVARELEDPFKPTHLNDLGLPQLQAKFNSKLRAASPPLQTLIHSRKWIR